MTLYAGWYELDVQEDLVEYIRDCDEQISFLIHSDLELTGSNLADHIRLEELDSQYGKSLAVQKQADGYLLYAADGFVPGCSYRIDILSPKQIYFSKAGGEEVANKAVNSFSFTIFREGSDHVVYQTDIIPLAHENVLSLEALAGVIGEEGRASGDQGKTIFRMVLLIGVGDVQPGQIVNYYEEGGSAEQNHFYKVRSTGQGPDGPYLDLVEPNLVDVYSELDIYYKGCEGPISEKLAADPKLEADLLASFKDSEGYTLLCSSISSAIEESPTLNNLIATLGDDPCAIQAIGAGDLKNLLNNVNLDLDMRLTKDKLTDNYSGAYGRVTYSIKDAKLPLHEKVSLKISMNVTEELDFSIYGSINWDKKDDLLINKGFDVTNHFKMNYDIMIMTDGNTINITDEIQKIINSLDGDKTQQVVASLNDEGFFGKDLDYLEILSKELGKGSFDIYKVLSFQFIFNLKVSMGARCGLNLNVDATESRRIGLSNWNNAREMRLVNARISSRLSFSATLKGRVGIRAGFEISGNISLFGLNSIANVGLAVEIGVYEEMTGFLRFNYEYKYWGGDKSSSSDKTLTGPYGSAASFLEVPDHSGNAYYRYQFDGWSDRADGTKGSDYTSFTINGNQTLYAVYEQQPRNMTLTFAANGGQFTDKIGQKTVTAPYNRQVSFTEVPGKADSTFYTYEFAGWSPDPLAAQGQKVSQFTVTGNITLYAVYRPVPKTFTITFDAGEGLFNDGSKEKKIQCAYSDLLPVFLERPYQAESDAYTYSFRKWDPAYSAGSIMNGPSTHTAVYEARAKDPQEGIWISNQAGSKEQISLGKEPTIAGYRFALGDDTSYGTCGLPTLCILGNGLTISGSEPGVCLVIDPAVTEVSFNKLSLAVSYSYGGAILYAEKRETDQEPLPLLINIKGDCSVTNTLNEVDRAHTAVRIERPLTLKGVAAGSTLQFKATDGTAFYCSVQLTIEDLHFTAQAFKEQENINETTTPIMSDSHIDAGWLFINSAVNLVSLDSAAILAASLHMQSSSLTVSGGVSIGGDLTLSGTSSADISSVKGNSCSVHGKLVFDNLRGSFQLKAQGAGAIALLAKDGIEFKGAGYNTNGAAPGQYDDIYYTFFANGLPLQEVKVTR